MASNCLDTSVKKPDLELLKLVEPVKLELEEVETWLTSNLVDDEPFIGRLLTEIFRPGGKRIRPLLVILCSRATQIDRQLFSRLHIILAVLTELIHTASLVHDDVLDESSLRRGVKTLNRRFDDKTAVLMGDLLFAQASICLARIMNPSIVGIYGQVLGDLCAGEINQLHNQFSTKISWENYLTKSEYKTAALFAAGSQSGAILNGHNDQVIQSLKIYGCNLGLCFQIVDDVLDVIGDQGKLGKKPGSDLRGGIFTAPTLFVLESDNQDAKRLEELILSRDIVNEDGVQRALQIIQVNGGVEKAMTLAKKYADIAKRELQNLNATIYRDSLFDLVDYVLTRAS